MLRTLRLGLFVLLAVGCSKMRPAAPVAQPQTIYKPTYLPKQKEAEDIVRTGAMVWIQHHSKDPMKWIAVRNLGRPRVMWVTGQRCNGRDFPVTVIEYLPHPAKCFHGINFNWHYIYVAKRSELSKSALSHEMAHSYARILLGHPDAGHKNREYWNFFEVTVNKVIADMEKQ